MLPSAAKSGDGDFNPDVDRLPYFSHPNPFNPKNERWPKGMKKTKKKNKNSKNKAEVRKKTSKTPASRKAQKRSSAKKRSAGKKRSRPKKANAATKRAAKKRGSADRVFGRPAEQDTSEVESGDLQGLSRLERADSESVDELLEEGNSFEAGVVEGVESADDADEREVSTHEVPEDDVPGEYLDEE